MKHHPLGLSLDIENAFAPIKPFSHRTDNMTQPGLHFLQVQRSILDQMKGTELVLMTMLMFMFVFMILMVMMMMFMVVMMFMFSRVLGMFNHERAGQFARFDIENLRGLDLGPLCPIDPGQRLHFAN